MKFNHFMLMMLGVFFILTGVVIAAPDPRPMPMTRHVVDELHVAHAAAPADQTGCTWQGTSSSTRIDLTCVDFTPTVVAATSTSTAVPSTNTPVPPTSTATAMPTNTPIPPTNTPVVPTATATPKPAPVAGQTCPTWVEAEITMQQAGQTWPTWHPPIDQTTPGYQSPVSAGGSGCLFRHEHGNSPDLFKPGFKVPFHIADMTEEGHVDENAWGSKVYALPTMGQYRWMFTQHFGTWGVARVCQRYHEVGVYIMQPSTGELVAELHFMGDYGGAYTPNEAGPNNPGNVAYRPTACMNQAQDAQINPGGGVKHIPLFVGTDKLGYEPWTLGLGRVTPVLGLSVGPDVNTPSLMQSCEAIICDVPNTRGSDGSDRFVTWNDHFGLQAPAASTTANQGRFCTTAKADAVVPCGTAGSIEQFVKPGLSAEIDHRAQDEHARYDRVRLPNGNWDWTSPWKRLMKFNNDEGGAAICETFNCTGPN